MEMKPVYSATDLKEVILLQAALRAEGIESILENQYSSHSVAWTPASLAPMVISVPEGEADRAIDIIRQASPRRDPDVAPAAEDLDRDLTSIPCPCGKTLEVPRELKGSSVDCPWCGRAVTVAG